MKLILMLMILTLNFTSVFADDGSKGGEQASSPTSLCAEGRTEGKNTDGDNKTKKPIGTEANQEG